MLHMEFVTIHDLSRELNTPARVIRNRLINLIAEGRFKEQDDFRRDDFKDDQHFVWKIHPLRFMQETGLKPPPPSTTDTKIENQPPPAVNQSANTPPQAVNALPKIVTQLGTTIDTKAEDRFLAREMIDILKEQIRVKDSQLSDVGEQLKETHELNVKLTGTMLRQADEIRNLLRLTGGKTEMAEMATKEPYAGNGGVNQDDPIANNVDNDSGKTGYQTGNENELRKAA
jgi:hypothetical protein